MDEYETLKRIGDGTFGTVFLCKRRGVNPHVGATQSPNTSSLVAIKRMKMAYSSWNDCMSLREVKALKKLNHKNVIILKEVVRENNSLYLVFEHMEENLHQLIRKQTVPFPESTIRQIVVQLLEGLAHIHGHGFFHRDIKPENLLCQNGAKLIKIADFGLTREIDSQPPYTDYVSTRWYRAPELLLHSTAYSWTVDIWAVGCIVGELYTLRPMFPGMSEIDQIYKICQVLGPPNAISWPDGQRLASLLRLNFPKIVPLSLNNLLEGCTDMGSDFIKTILRWVPSERPSAGELLVDRYFRR